MAGLVGAANQTLIVSPATLAAPQVLYYNGTYFLSTEILESVWKVRMYAGTNPLGPFAVLPGNPVLDDGCACLFQHLIETKIYEYYCKQATNGTWTLDMRVVDTSTGRIIYQEGVLDNTKWTADGGTWTVTSAMQPDGSTGPVAQGTTSDKQVLMSSFTGSDYTLEGYGKQLAGRIWGLGAESLTAKIYTQFIFMRNSDNDPLHNLHYYTWNNGTVTQDVFDDLGVIDMNTWYKLKVKAHGSAFDIYFNDIYQTTSNDATFGSGAVALFSEGGNTAQFDDIRVRKYAATEPLGSISTTEESPGQWTGASSDDWSIAGNWSSGVPGPCSIVTIPSAPINQPRVTGTTPFECLSLGINDGSVVTVDAGAALTVIGNLSNSGSLLLSQPGLPV